MKILIISLPRTGSTSLLHKISKEKNLKPYFEPFDGSGRVIYNNEDNSVVKTIICQHDNNIKLSESFDEIILLSRRDLKACAESHSYRVHNSSKGFNSNQQYFWEETPIDQIAYDDIIKWNDEIHSLSKILNVPITYYEDIFDPNSENRLRLGNKKDINKTLI